MHKSRFLSEKVHFTQVFIYFTEVLVHIGIDRYHFKQDLYVRYNEGIYPG